MVETIEIVKTDIDGKFGKQVLLHTGKYASFSPKYSGNKAPALGKYQAEIYLTEKGNVYLNSLSLVEAKAVKVVETVVAPEAAKEAPKRKFVPRVEKKEDVDWDEVNKGKVRCHLMGSLISNPNIVQDLTQNTKPLEEYVDHLTEYVMGNK